MVRLGLIVMVLVLTGCSALGDAFSGDPQVAGTAAGQTLTVDRLANMVGRAQRIPVRPDVLTGVANVYLDYAVFATELGRGRDLHDSALVLATQWPVAARAATHGCGSSPECSAGRCGSRGVRRWAHAASWWPRWRRWAGTWTSRRGPARTGSSNRTTETSPATKRATRTTWPDWPRPGRCGHEQVGVEVRLSPRAPRAPSFPAIGAPGRRRG